MTMKLTVVLENIRSTYNVGAILRTCEGFGVAEAVFSGYTPFPGARPDVLPHVAEKQLRQIKKTALGAEKLVPCRYVADLPEFLRNQTVAKVPVVALENNLEDSRLRPLAEVASALAGAERAVLILGEEVSGIRPELYPFVSYFAEIPMRGRKESFNVSVATGIALYALTTL